MISIITPCYNAGKFLPETINSVLNQSFKDWELLIIDDCSSDNSRQIVEEYALKDSRIRYFRTDTPSGSPSYPRNIGIENSNGEYIAFLDADDIWLPDKLDDQIKFMYSNNYEFVYSNYEKIDENGKRSNRFIIMPPRSTFWDVVETCTIPCLTAIMAKEIIGDTRFLNIPKEDFAFWLEILKKNVTAYNTQKIHALYREHRKSRSANKWSMIRNQWFVLRKVEGIKPFLASYFMMKYLVHGIIKFAK